jgi:OOP family OmpA-OmpF porin
MKKLAVGIVLAITMAGCGGVQGRVVLETSGPVAPAPQPVACVEQWVHMPVHIGFPSGGTEIDAQNRMILAEVVRTAQHRDDIRRVRVEGHTDTCGSEMSNLALSQSRAVSVAEELVALGVPRERLETVGYGSVRPLGEEQCGRGQALTRQVNRRVEFTLLVCRP